jgi:cysteine desulfurase family protein (TIGR01976 family)
MNATRYDVDFVRRQFPALEGEWTFMDNAGGSQTLQSVVDRMTSYLLTSNVQHGASYAPSEQAVLRVREATQAMAAFTGASENEVIIGASTTALLQMVSRAVATTIKPGDEVIVTNCDHEANIGPWLSLEAAGATIRWWRVSPDSLRLETEDLQALLNERTRLVACTHTSNILGTINPIETWAPMVRSAGAMMCVDGVAFAPHRAINFHELGVDFYAFSTYKTYGPHQAVLLGREALLKSLPGNNHFFIGADEVPYKFQPGNVNYELAYSLTGIGDYVAEFSRHHGLKADGSSHREFFAQAAEYEEALATPLVNFLKDRRAVRIIGDDTAKSSVRVPTVSFVVEGMRSDEVPLQVDKHHIGIRFGDFYARRLLDDLGLSDGGGVVRVSLVHYNTVREVEKLITVLDSVLPG